MQKPKHIKEQIEAAESWTGQSLTANSASTYEEGVRDALKWVLELELFHLL